MGFTVADLKRMRESREARIAANRANLSNTDREYLLTENLAKGVKLWYPKKDKPEEVTMRIVDFMTTKKFNVAGNAEGTFDAFRRIRVHRLADGRNVICPTSYGKPCPLCECVDAHYEEIKKDRNSPYAKLKPRKLILFNMFVKVADESGKTKIVPRVFRGTEFYFMDVFNSTLSTEEQFNAKAGDKLYSFSDLDVGYWMDARFGMAPSVKANPQSKPIMQLLSMQLRWKEETKPIPEALYQYITDLDALIPEPPAYDELARLISDTPVSVPDTNANAAVEEEAAISVEGEAEPAKTEVAKEPEKPEVETEPAADPTSFGQEVGSDDEFDIGDDFDIG